ncbi:MAG: hypothetical protein SF069_00920 [Phycisphaerae bacterium]|nr:hypothetical protein [Phycisphaerae bacterium]
MVRSAQKLCHLCVAIFATLFWSVPAGAWHSCADHHAPVGGGAADIASHCHCEHNHGDTGGASPDCTACLNVVAATASPVKLVASLDHCTSSEAVALTDRVVGLHHSESHPVRGPPAA